MATNHMPTDQRPARVGLVERIPIAHEVVSLGAWLLAVLATEVAIHGVGAPFRHTMPLFLVFTVAIALLAGQRYRRTGLPHWLLASFSATLISLNGFLYAYTGIGTTLHDVHVASDMAAIGTAFFLLVESFTPGVGASRAASLASFLACCGLLLVIPALLFGLGPVSLRQLLELINTEGTSRMLTIPSWVPFVGLVPALAGLALGNAKLVREERGGMLADSPRGASCRAA